MGGLARICRYYGSMQVNDITYLWDYVADKPVESKEMPVGGKRWKASERKRAELLKAQFAASHADNLKSNQGEAK